MNLPLDPGSSGGGDMAPPTTRLLTTTFASAGGFGYYEGAGDSITESINDGLTLRPTA